MEGKPKGYGIVEVVITLGLVSLIVVSIGRLLISASELDKASKEQIIASILMQEPMEIISAQTSALFACHCVSMPDCDSCGCEPLPGYTSCWEESPQGDYKLAKSGASWSLENLPAGTEEAVEDHQGYYRIIKIENIEIDALGNINYTPPSSARPDMKLVTITVRWESKGHEKKRSIQKIFTAWENP